MHPVSRTLLGRVEVLAFLLVAVGKVAVLEVVFAIVFITSVAVVIVATPEVVDVEVEVLLAAY